MHHFKNLLLEDIYNLKESLVFISFFALSNLSEISWFLLFSIFDGVWNSYLLAVYLFGEFKSLTSDIFPMWKAFTGETLFNLFMNSDYKWSEDNYFFINYNFFGVLYCIILLFYGEVNFFWVSFKRLNLS